MSECYPTAVRTFAISFFNNSSALIAIIFPFVSGYLSDVSIPWLYPNCMGWDVGVSIYCITVLEL